MPRLPRRSGCGPSRRRLGFASPILFPDCPRPHRSTLARPTRISLAKERGITDVLIDEYEGRKVAASEGLFALPTLAVLEKAAERRLLDLRPTLEALRRTSYRIRDEMIDAALKRDAARKRTCPPL